MIYLDNSATTNPKPPAVIREMNKSVTTYSYNSGRGGYSKSVLTSEKIFDVREKLSHLLNTSCENIAFTANCTTALNIAIKGLVKSGDHVIISPLEHNAVARPVHSLFKEGRASYDIAKYSCDKELQIKNFSRLIRPNTSVIVCTMASNVFGVTMPIRDIGKLAHDNNITFVVDGAQGVGIFDVDMVRDNVDILCGAGHKGLYGPLAEGFIAINGDRIPASLIEGGTGSYSVSLEQPQFLPDKFESGSLNNSLIMGMGAGIDFVNSIGIEKIHTHEANLIEMLNYEFKKMDNVILYSDFCRDYAPIISFNINDYSSEKTASLLSQKGICTRGGLHCAPLAHSTFGTLERGTVRVSPSVFTTQRECEIFINHIKKL